ncbi:MAG: flippase [Ignavibacteriales bacterium]|nr:flippase [Ignavibacteriales bacterium]
MNKPSELRPELLARNTALNVVGQIIPVAIGFFTVPYVVGKLGTDRFGLLSLVWAFLGYFTVFDLGLGRATTKFVAENLGKGEGEKLPQIAGTAVGIQLLMGSLASLVLMIGSPYLINNVLNIPLILRPEAKQIFLIVSLAIPVILVSGSLRGILEAMQRFDLVNSVKIPAASLNFLLPAIGVALGFNLFGIVSLLILAWVGTLAALLLINFKINPQLRKISISRALFQDLFSFGGWVTLSSIAAPLFTYLERFVIASYLTVGVLTYYTIPYEIISRLVVLPASFAATLFPAFSFYGAENRSKIEQLLSRPIKYLVVAVGPVVAIFIIYAHQILALWLGEEFAQRGADVLRILAFTFFFHALAHVPFTAVQGLGRPDLKAKFDIAMLPIFTGICLLLIPKQGIMGAAVAKFCITFFDLTYLSWMALRLSQLSLKEMFGTGFAKIMLFIGLFAGMNFYFARAFNSILITLLAIVLSGILYAILFIWFVVDEKDKETFHSVKKYFLSLLGIT